MKNEKGITLIALVITIIVLIILAAVSIGMLTGNSSILSNTETARSNTAYAGIMENMNTELQNIKAECIVNETYLSASTYDAFVNKFSASGYTTTIRNNTAADTEGTTNLTASDSKYTLANKTTEFGTVIKVVYTTTENDGTSVTITGTYNSKTRVVKVVKS